MPDSYRYTDENPYVSNGKGRNSTEGKAYVGLDADVAEFEDMYFNTAWNGGINKMGLGVDEYCDACIQFSRKNYADLMPDGKVKKVGNTIKSRAMAAYLEKFMDLGIDLLLHGRGYDFINAYYDYLERIYNYQIPIRDIASKGKIKKTLKEYMDDCKGLTKAGTKKSRQAWYELAINNKLKVDVGDTVYYINTGTKKSQSDVKRVTRYFTTGADGGKVEITRELEKKYSKRIKDAADHGVHSKVTKAQVLREEWNGKAWEEDQIIMFSELVPSEIVNSEEDILCSDVDGLEYNVDKYIYQFNKRIAPLLVCFSPEIRDNIIISDPKDRRFFTEDEASLVGGYPNKPEDQDTYEALMTPERKEIAFWVKVGKKPPFVDECGIEWDRLVEEYEETLKAEEDAVFKEENEKYLKAIESLTDDDIEAFESDAKIPKAITDVVHLCEDLRFRFNKLPKMTPSTGGYVFDDISTPDIIKDEF